MQSVYSIYVELIAFFAPQSAKPRIGTYTVCCKIIVHEGCVVTQFLALFLAAKSGEPNTAHESLAVLFWNAFDWDLVIESKQHSNGVVLKVENLVNKII
jgi:hypothetical protein